jgi:hypothetical protein
MFCILKEEEDASSEDEDDNGNDDSIVMEKNSQGRSIKDGFLKSNKDELMTDSTVESNEIYSINDENGMDNNRKKDDKIEENILDLEDRENVVVDKHISLAHHKRGSSVDSVMGRRSLPNHKRAKVPQGLLKKLARIGGMGLLPFVIYPSSPDGQARPPVAWLWCYRILKCKYCEGLAMELRFLESCIKVRDLPSMDKKMQEKMINGVPSIQHKDIVIEKKTMDENPGIFLSDSSFSCSQWGDRSEDRKMKVMDSSDAVHTYDLKVANCDRDIGIDGIASRCAALPPVDASSGNRSVVGSATYMSRPNCALTAKESEEVSVGTGKPYDLQLSHSSQNVIEESQSESTPLLGKSSLFSSSFCWWEVCGGDLIAFAASSCQLRLSLPALSPSPSSSVSTATSTNLIDAISLSGGYRKEYWDVYKTALASILEDWSVSLTGASNAYPYSLIIIKECALPGNTSVLLKKPIRENGTEVSTQNLQNLSLPLCCLRDFLDREFLIDLINISQDNLKSSNKFLKFVGEYGSLIIDVLIEGGVMNTENMNENCSVDELLLHKTLIEELKIEREKVNQTLNGMFSIDIAVDNGHCKDDDNSDSDKIDGADVPVDMNVRLKYGGKSLKHT